jgi:hypothetical protein
MSHPMLTAGDKTRHRANHPLPQGIPYFYTMAKDISITLGFFGIFMLPTICHAGPLSVDIPFQQRDITSNLPSASKSTGNRPFVIRETYQYTPSEPAPRERGIIGLDMLINPAQYPVVKAVLNGTPAQRRGILPGDVIVAINGTSATGKELAEVDAMISDVPGESVSFSILRGTRLFSVQVTIVSLAQVSQALQNSYAFLLNSK